MLEILHLNTTEGKLSYKKWIANLGISEPYFLLDYFEVFSGGLENLICFLYTTHYSKSFILMPGYLKPITIANEKTTFFDFITPYGYTGPIITSEIQESEMIDFWKAVDEWHKKNNVVAEFVRFDLFKNKTGYSGNVVPTMLNIKGQIINEETQWTSFDAKVRKNVNKAKREGLCSKIYHLDIEDINISEFYEIYIKTMERTEAKESFFYTLEQFNFFIKNNNERVAICTIYFEEIPISSELLLVSDNSIYSFLGGTDENYFDKRPNDFLKVAATDWARTAGKENYILGGGYGFEDGIFKYKKAFFPNDAVSYCTGRKILNQEKYDYFVEKASEFRLSTGLEKLDVNDGAFFPLYNKIN